MPDTAGLSCVLVAVACLAHVPRAWSRRAVGSGVWSLSLTLLAAQAGAYRVLSLTDYLHDPNQIHVKVSLAELLILVLAVALIVPDAIRAQAATHPPPRPAPSS